VIDPIDSEVPSQIDHLFTPEEDDELAELMISFDGGMLDYGELDGFLSALAVAPQATTLDRWWPMLFGPEPDWETDEDPIRAKALIERYYAMVQARVAISPFELGEDALPPLWSMTDLNDNDDDDDDEEQYDADDHDFDAESSRAEVQAFAALRQLTAPQPSFAPQLDVDDDDNIDDEEIDADDIDDDIDDADDDEIFDTEAADDIAEFGDADGMDMHFSVGETWLSGFRFAMSLQSSDWRAVLEEEPKLARWLNALWEAADSAQGQQGPLDSLPGMAPSAAVPEDAGFLALEASLRVHSRDQETPPVLDETILPGVIPAVLHQLWRRHREQVGEVADALEQDIETGLGNFRLATIDNLAELLDQHAAPAGGMNLEQLDGFWTAIRASGVESSPFESLVRVFGPDKVWDDAEEAREVMSALVQYWALIGERLMRKPDPNDPLCFPHFAVPEDRDSDEPDPKFPYCRDFARSFMAAVDEFPRSTKLLLMDPEAKHWLAPIEALAEGRSLEKRGAKLLSEERLALVSALPHCIAGLSSYFAVGAATPHQPARAEVLPGRNDPCPCGSGKKYKKCHGAPERLN